MLAMLQREVTVNQLIFAAINFPFFVTMGIFHVNLFSQTAELY